MKKLCLLFLLISAGIIDAQQRFSLAISPSSITATPAIHSGAFGTYNHKWFFIGGRTNGLHGFLPPLAFPTDYINDQIYIVDPVTNHSWSASTYDLPDSIREPITSTNMEFYLRDTILYMIGGYGWKNDINNFITWPTLTAINMKGLMQAVISGQSIVPYFRQIKDTTLAICGAHLEKLDSTFYLVFGHRFDGYYNRTDSGGFYSQHYSYEIRKFEIEDDGQGLSISNYRVVRDTNNFRRRDFNLMRFLDPFRGEGLLAYGGVFQPQHNLPYLNPIEIFKDTVIIRNDFNQNLCQYHSATCALYDSISLTMHTLFFGGMSLYYIDSVSGQQVQDSMVPFVRTISDVVRTLDFTYLEFNAGVHMPALMGTNAYFFMDDSIPLFNNYYVHLNATQYPRRIGYIVGGIESPSPNISTTDASASFANSTVYEVYLNAPVDGIEPVSNEILNFAAYPNPAPGAVNVEFLLNQKQHVRIDIMDFQGRVLQEVCNKTFEQGKQKLLLDISAYPKGVYNCVLTFNNHRKAIRLEKD